MKIKGSNKTSLNKDTSHYHQMLFYYIIKSRFTEATLILKQYSNSFSCTDEKGNRLLSIDASPLTR